VAVEVEVVGPDAEGDGAALAQVDLEAATDAEEDLGVAQDGQHQRPPPINRESREFRELTGTIRGIRVIRGSLGPLIAMPT
jgi:hypothetical protein